MLDWQPIETAPRDGNDILVYWPIVAVDDGGDLTDRIVNGQAFVSAWVPGDYWWEPTEVESGCDEDDTAFAPQPSHWMPLPPLPPLPAA